MMDKNPNLADLGDWQTLKVERFAHRSIRHAYESVLNASARLMSFATGGPSLTDGPITERQETLAVQDLIEFAIHARRLVDLTIKNERRFSGVFIRPRNPRKRPIKIRTAVNVLVHHNTLHIVRSEWRVASLTRTAFAERLAYPNKWFQPFVYVRSHRDECMFDLRELIETFQLKIVLSIIEICAEQQLFLEEM